MPPVAITPDALQQVLAHVREGYPNEVCGVLLGPQDQAGVCTTAKRLDNVQDRYHALDPEQFPRTAATAYRFNDMEHVRLLKDAAGMKLQQRVIYHSHVDNLAYFSQEDVDQALWEGEPRFPGVDYLVVGTRDGRVVEANLYRHAQAAQFERTPVTLPELP